MNTIRVSRHKILVGALYTLLLSFLATSAVEAAERLVSGKWEYAMTTNGATRTIAGCLSSDEAASINGDSRSARDFAEKKGEKRGSPCKIKSYELTGDTQSYALACGDSTITDKTVYHGETSEGVKTVTHDGKTITTRIKSRRIGTCQ